METVDMVGCWELEVLVWLVSYLWSARRKTISIFFRASGIWVKKLKPWPRVLPLRVSIFSGGGCGCEVYGSGCEVYGCGVEGGPSRTISIFFWGYTGGILGPWASSRTISIFSGDADADAKCMDGCGVSGWGVHGGILGPPLEPFQFFSGGMRMRMRSVWMDAGYQAGVQKALGASLEPFQFFSGGGCGCGCEVYGWIGVRVSGDGLESLGISLFQTTLLERKLGMLMRSVWRGGGRWEGRSCMASRCTWIFYLRCNLKWG